MPTATNRKRALRVSQQDLNYCGYLLCVLGLDEAFRRELRCQGPIRVNALGIQAVIGHVDIWEAGIHEGLTLSYTLSQLLSILGCTNGSLHNSLDAKFWIIRSTQLRSPERGSGLFLSSYSLDSRRQMLSMPMNDRPSVRESRCVADG